jgi:hypothetical protein
LPKYSFHFPQTKLVAASALRHGNRNPQTRHATVERRSPRHSRRARSPGAGAFRFIIYFTINSLQKSIKNVRTVCGPGIDESLFGRLSNRISGASQPDPQIVPSGMLDYLRETCLNSSKVARGRGAFARFEI